MSEFKEDVVEREREREREKGFHCRAARLGKGEHNMMYL
jgi:hypothetical protein